MSYIKLSQVIIESPDYIAKYKFDLIFWTDLIFYVVLFPQAGGGGVRF